MLRKPSPLLIWTLIVLSATASTSPPAQPTPTPTPITLRENDPLSYAAVYARRTDNQYALSQIAIVYAGLGEFERALQVNESVTDEHWRTGALGEIALEYWKQGERQKARELFLRVANLPLPKDVTYIWGKIIENMAEARQFDLALDIDSAIATRGDTIAGHELATIVEEFIEANDQNPNLPDILPRVISIARTIPESNNSALKMVAVAYAARSQHDRAIKLIQQHEEDYDREDAAHQVAIQYAKLGLYDRALQLATIAGDYYRERALIGIATEALKRRDNSKALEFVTRTDALLSKARKNADYTPSEGDAHRLSELAVLYSQLDRKSRAIELADLSFKTARALGKPAYRFGALQNVVNGFRELGLYDKAIEATKALDNEGGIPLSALAEVGAHALRKGQLDVVEKIVKTIESTPLNDNEESRVRALVVLARAQAEQGRYEEARKLLLSVMPLVEKLVATENTPEALKNFAVAFAEAGDIRAALQQVPRIGGPFFTTQALIDIGTLCAKKKLTLDDCELAALDAIVAKPILRSRGLEK